jgi:hypothetical protein
MMDLGQEMCPAGQSSPSVLGKNMTSAGLHRTTEEGVEGERTKNLSRRKAGAGKLVGRTK